ncbi:MAG: metal ABC transporter ATP-binding protein [Parcubacteria group bacterium]|nr:metal ABC transporter ATP-binding protein [Parcubacteria group bacterium]
MPLLEVKNLSVLYGKEKTVENVSFSIDKGETIAVIGPNGSGKTTLLRALIGALPSRGEITMEKGVSMGYVPQKLDVERNLPLTGGEFLNLAPRSEEKPAYSAKEIIRMVGLPLSHLQKSLSAFSSGEFQRLLMGFALKTRPSLLLFDEPTASVDVGGQETIYELLHRLQDKDRFAAILVSHDLATVYQYATKVLSLNKRQISFGPPEEVLTPEGLEKLYGGGRRFYHHLHE